MINLKKLLIQIMNTTPVGKIDMYAGSTAPVGWLLCNGQAISREEYPVLFAAIGTTYGAGDGSTTFNVPDLRDRVPVGAGNSYNLNDKNGNDTISYTPAGTIGGTTLTDAQIAHGHGFTQPSVTDGSCTTSSTSKTLTGWFSGRKRGNPAAQSFWAGGICTYVNSTTNGWTHGDSTSVEAKLDTIQIDATHTHTIPAHTHTVSGGSVSDLHGASSTRTSHDHTWTGTTTTLDVRQPYMGINFIIYTGNK